MDILERRKRARDSLLGAPIKFKSIGVKVGELYYAVREPTIGERAEINAAATGQINDAAKMSFDLGNHQVAGMLKCVFVAEPVMEPVYHGAPAAIGEPPATQVAMESLPVLDAKGEPVLDEAGQPKLETFPRVTCGFTKQERLFEDTDLAGLRGQPVSSFANVFIPLVQRLLNPKTEDARKSNG